MDQDPQVKTLKAKIQDWSTCPTTDPQTKRAIVGRLEVQLNSLESALTEREKAKQEQLSAATGLGAALDLSA